MKTKVNIVWLKRDLRTQDHAPLKAAEEAGIPYVIFYLFEPSLLAYPDSSDRHLRFVYHALKDMNRHLQKFDRQVRTLYGEALESLSIFTRNFRGPKSVFLPRKRDSVDLESRQSRLKIFAIPKYPLVSISKRRRGQRA